RSQINGLNQAVTNAQDAIGMIQTAEGALTEVHSMLQRMVTLTTQAANGTMNTTASTNIETEYAALMKEIDRIANYTDFNGTRPLSSKDGKATGAGIAKMTFQIGPSSNETIGVESKNLMYSAIVNAKGTGCSDYKTSNLTNKTMAAKNLTALNVAINDVAKYRAKLGAAQNRLEHTVNSLKVTSENIQSAESRIRDTNMPDEITSFTKNNILLQAAQSMLSQANAVPQSVLSLLG
ncbi:MAG: flagellin, partial [Lachnospiraceae bacterium]|nr:flagellin [Lachnospiraceae bacterium]